MKRCSNIFNFYSQTYPIGSIWLLSNYNQMKYLAHFSFLGLLCGWVGSKEFILVKTLHFLLVALFSLIFFLASSKYFLQMELFAEWKVWKKSIRSLGIILLYSICCCANKFQCSIWKKSKKGKDSFLSSIASSKLALRSSKLH